MGLLNDLTVRRTYVVIRNTCPDEPRIVDNVTHEELLKELGEWRDCGDTSWKVYVLGEPDVYQLQPAVIKKVMDFPRAAE